MSIGRGPGRPRDPAVDESIERAAWQVLATQGPRRLSPERVAEEAGVAVSTVYRRYRTGDDLLLSLMNRVYDAFPTPDTGSLRCDLVELMNGVSRALTPLAPRRAMIVGLVAALEDNPDVAEAYGRALLRRREQTEEIVRRAIDRGDLASGVDPTVVVEMLAGFATYRLVVAREELSSEMVESLVDIVLDGVRAR